MSSNRPSFSLRSGFARTASVLTLLGVALVLSSCAVNPATGQANIVTMSEKRELEIGAEEHAKVMSSMPLVEDESLTAYINEVGQRLAAVSDRPDLTYTFTVIDSPEINAFALPGGYVYVNRGLLAYLNSEAELAAVIGHDWGAAVAWQTRDEPEEDAEARLKTLGERAPLKFEERKLEVERGEIPDGFLTARDLEHPNRRSGDPKAHALVARAMAEGAQVRAQVQLTVAVTGIAGPGGAVPGKPVGTVWLATAGPDGTRAERLHFAGDRDAVRARTVATALQRLTQRAVAGA